MFTFRSFADHNKRMCQKTCKKDHDEMQHVVSFDLNILVYGPFDQDMVWISMFNSRN